MAIAPPATVPLDVTRPPKRKTSRNGHLLRLPFYLLSLTMIAPFYWMVISVLKPYSELTRQPRPSSRTRRR